VAAAEDGAAWATRNAKARAELAQIVARGKLRGRLLRKWGRDGSFALRKDIGASGQIVIPVEVVSRWTDQANQGVAVLLLDLGWGVLVVPESEARGLLDDLQVDPAQLARRASARD